MRRRRFAQLDVFASEPFSGNPLACVIDADGLSTEEMHRFTKWTNLSEASFLLKPTVPEADYRVRIFTAPRELPFAGHPTIGSCQAWLNAGGQPKTSGRIVQECGAGLVELKQTDDQIAFAAPPLIRAGEVEESFIVEMAAVLGIGRDEVIDAQWGDNGPGWVVLMLESAEAVLALTPPTGPLAELDLGVVGLYPDDSDLGCAVEIRAFFADGTGAIFEDPVTGSLNASVAHWLLKSGQLTAPYVASQGAALGRRGRISIDQDPDGTIWVGGVATESITGEIEI
ncbi:MAG: PhzF family phenazine biosynthesis protein [Acidimicrobiales bacterium]